MKRKKVIFEKVGTSSAYRCLLKNQHGRKICIELRTETRNGLFLSVGILIGTSVRQVIKENRQNLYYGIPRN